MVDRQQEAEAAKVDREERIATALERILAKLDDIAEILNKSRLGDKRG